MKSGSADRSLHGGMAVGAAVPPSTLRVGAGHTGASHCTGRFRGSARNSPEPGVPDGALKAFRATAGRHTTSGPFFGEAGLAAELPEYSFLLTLPLAILGD